MHNLKQSQRHGFTLIELSIVLVIIGLIVGGVLVGQDLIKAAEIRATVSQYEKYNAAMNTFLGKYNGLPGDIAAADATAFGLVTRTGAAARGDGNGLIEGLSTATPSGSVGNTEARLFWADLSTANLVDGSYTGTDALTAITAATADTVFPPAKLGRGTYFIIGSHNGLNYYAITAFTGANAVTATTGVYSATVGLTPIEAFNIDSKVDDGQPNTGTVVALGAAVPASMMNNADAANEPTGDVLADVATGDCTLQAVAGTPAATDTYNRNQSTGGESPGCNLRLRTN